MHKTRLPQEKRDLFLLLPQTSMDHCSTVYWIHGKLVQDLFPSFKSSNRLFISRKVTATRWDDLKKKNRDMQKQKKRRARGKGKETEIKKN